MIEPRNVVVSDGMRRRRVHREFEDRPIGS
jgi:hypothetical protein